MSFSQLVFSSEGRIRRRTYWLYGITVAILSWIALGIDTLLGTYNSDSGFGVVQVIFSLVVLIPGIMVCIKRAHDRDRSGWFILIIFVPILNLWPAIELGFIGGTNGPNKYGPDPKQPQVPQVPQATGV